MCASPLGVERIPKQVAKANATFVMDVLRGNASSEVGSKAAEHVEVNRKRKKHHLEEVFCKSGIHVDANWKRMKFADDSIQLQEPIRGKRRREKNGISGNNTPSTLPPHPKKKKHHFEKAKQGVVVGVEELWLSGPKTEKTFKFTNPRTGWSEWKRPRARQSERPFLQSCPVIYPS